MEAYDSLAFKEIWKMSISPHLGEVVLYCLLYEKLMRKKLEKTWLIAYYLGQNDDVDYASLYLVLTYLSIYFLKAKN